MKQTNDIDALIRLAYEAEGLLHLLRDRGDSTPDDLLALLAEKTSMLQAGVMELPCGTVAEEDAAVTPEQEPCTSADDAEAIAEAVEEETLADADMDTEPEEVSAPEPEPESEPETLDERLARERARDIFKAFTINDKFRYCRELFHGSESEFKETLGIISGMSSFAEAEEYFYEDLCWDADDENVKAFMDIVRRHF